MDSPNIEKAEQVKVQGNNKGEEFLDLAKYKPDQILSLENVNKN